MVEAAAGRGKEDVWRKGRRRVAMVRAKPAQCLSVKGEEKWYECHCETAQAWRAPDQREQIASEYNRCWEVFRELCVSLRGGASKKGQCTRQESNAGARARGGSDERCVQEKEEAIDR